MHGTRRFAGPDSCFSNILPSNGARVVLHGRHLHRGDGLHILDLRLVAGVDRGPQTPHHDPHHERHDHGKADENLMPRCHFVMRRWWPNAPHTTPPSGKGHKTGRCRRQQAGEIAAIEIADALFQAAPCSLKWSSRFWNRDTSQELKLFYFPKKDYPV